METAGRDKQRQTLCCHLDSQEHPPAKSELLWQPPASYKAQVIICIHVSAAMTELRQQRFKRGFLHLPPQDFKEADLILFELFQTDSKRSAWESSKAWKIPALFAVLFKSRLFGSMGFFFHWKFCNFSYKSCYQATNINENSLSQWSRQFVRVAWCPNTIIMRTALNQ